MRWTKRKPPKSRVGKHWSARTNSNGKKSGKKVMWMIEGDPAAQQGIRFNIFQLNQSYRGDDARLNISPKGFTGEKYGGNTQWNTELCCVPYFLLSTPREISRKLLLYRYNQLPKAIETHANWDSAVEPPSIRW